MRIIFTTVEIQVKSLFTNDCLHAICLFNDTGKLYLFLSAEYVGKLVGRRPHGTKIRTLLSHSDAKKARGLHWAAMAVLALHARCSFRSSFY